MRKHLNARKWGKRSDRQTYWVLHTLDQLTTLLTGHQMTSPRVRRNNNILGPERLQYNIIIHYLVYYSLLQRSNQEQGRDRYNCADRRSNSSQRYDAIYGRVFGQQLPTNLVVYWVWKLKVYFLVLTRSQFIKTTRQKLNTVDRENIKDASTPHAVPKHLKMNEDESSDSFNETDNHKSNNRSKSLLRVSLHIRMLASKSRINISSF